MLFSLWINGAYAGEADTKAAALRLAEDAAAGTGEICRVVEEARDALVYEVSPEGEVESLGARARGE